MQLIKEAVESIDKLKEKFSLFLYCLLFHQKSCGQQFVIKPPHFTVLIIPIISLGWSNE